MLNSAAKLAHNIYTGILDLVYPSFCLICENVEQDSYLCAKCLEKIEIIGEQRCRKCGTPCESYLCPDCKVREYAFEYACSAGVFDGVLREAIHLFKYRGQVVIAKPLADLMIRCFPDTKLSGRIDAVIPIPIHSSRLLERGFNQSEELARQFCNKTRIPLVTDVLYKSRKTPRQVGLPFDVRVVNVAGSFGIRHAVKIRGKRVMLIDDVITTGSTVSEAARTLREAGAAVVYAYTLARGI